VENSLWKLNSSFQTLINLLQVCGLYTKPISVWHHNQEYSSTHEGNMAPQLPRALLCKAWSQVSSSGITWQPVRNSENRLHPRATVTQNLCSRTFSRWDLLMLKFEKCPSSKHLAYPIPHCRAHRAEAGWAGKEAHGIPSLCCMLETLPCSVI
jgi:hypothetical protein